MARVALGEGEGGGQWMSLTSWFRDEPNLNSRWGQTIRATATESVERVRQTPLTSNHEHIGRNIWWKFCLIKAAQSSNPLPCRGAEALHFLVKIFLARPSHWSSFCPPNLDTRWKGFPLTALYWLSHVISKSFIWWSVGIDRTFNPCKTILLIRL